MLRLLSSPPASSPTFPAPFSSVLPPLFCSGSVATDVVLGRPPTAGGCPDHNGSFGRLRSPGSGRLRGGSFVPSLLLSEKCRSCNSNALWPTFETSIRAVQKSVRLTLSGLIEYSRTPDEDSDNVRRITSQFGDEISSEKFVLRHKTQSRQLPVDNSRGSAIVPDLVVLIGDCIEL